MKNSRTEEPKVRSIDSALVLPQRFNNNKFSNKARKEKKKKRRQKD